MSDHKDSQKIKGFFQTIRYNPQAPDAFKRFHFKIGNNTKYSTLSLDQETPVKVWSDLNIYCQPPTIEHPLNFKISLYNNSGKAFATFGSSGISETQNVSSVQELRNFVTKLNKWLDEHEKDIDLLEFEEKRLSKFRNSYLMLKAYIDTDHIVTVDGKNILELDQIHHITECLKLIDKIGNESNINKQRIYYNNVKRLLNIIEDTSQIEEYLNIKLGNKIYEIEGEI